jgi:hypothetical protein
LILCCAAWDEQKTEKSRVFEEMYKHIEETISQQV